MRTLVLAVLVTLAAAVPAQAADNTFNGTVDGDWSNSGNWSAGHVPLSSEDVKVNVSGKNPTLSTGADGVANSITIASDNNVTVSGKTLTLGVGASSISGSMSLTSSAVLSVGGHLSLNRSGGPGAPDVTVNASRIDVVSGGTIDIAAATSEVADFFNTSLIHILPGGTLMRGVAGADEQMDIAIDNDGQVTATAGRMLLRGGTGGQTSDGVYSAASPATLAFQGTTNLSTSARMTGTGTMEFNGGTVTIPAGSTASPSAYNPSSTTFTLGNLSLGSDGTTGALSSIGGQRGGGGTLTVSGTATMSSFGTTFAGGVTNLNGTTTISSGLTVSGIVTLNATTSLVAGGGITDTGVLNVGSGGTLDLAADGVNVFDGGGGKMNVLSGGTVKRSAPGTDGQLGINVANAGTVSVDAGRLRVAGPNTLTQTAGVTDVKANELAGDVSLQGGVLKGTGTVTGNVGNSGGTVAPGASPGKLTIAGNYTQGAGGTLQEEIAGTAPGTQFDQLAVTGNATLDGTLAIASGSFVPALTDTFKIITGAATRTGTFAQLTGASFAGGQYGAQYDAEGVTLLVNGQPPTNVSPPSIAPSGHTGDTVACDPGTWTGSPTLAFSWTRDGAVIAGQSGSTYELIAADEAHAIRCRVTATNVGGTASADSTPLTASAPSAPAPTPTPTPGPAPTPSADVAAATAAPACLSIPAVTRNQVAPVRGGGKVLLATSQVDDPAAPLKASVRLTGKGAIGSVAFRVNGRAVAGPGRAAAAVPIQSLKIGSARNKLTAKVTLRDGRSVTVTQFLVVLRCPLPRVTCTRQADGRSLRCTAKTPLGARGVKVVVTRSATETAKGSATVRNGRYSVTVRSSVLLPPGRYAYKHVATTRKRGQRFQMIRLVVVA